MKGKKTLLNQLMMDYSLYQSYYTIYILAILVSQLSFFVEIRFRLWCSVIAYCMYLWTFPLVRCFKIEKSNNIIDNNISNLFLAQKVLTILKYVGSKSEWVLFRGWGGGGEIKVDMPCST